MFTENEVAIMLENDAIVTAVQALKDDFRKEEAQFLEISDHDFLSLVLLTPSVGIALANGSVSLFEELALNKKARKLSLGGYFMKKDPVVVAMGFLIKNYDKWNERFIVLIRKVIEIALDMEDISKLDSGEAEVTANSFRREVLKAPYGFVRFMSSFFCSDDDQIINVEQRSINKVEFDSLLKLGDQLGWGEIPLFKHFCATYTVK